MCEFALSAFGAGLQSHHHHAALTFPDHSTITVENAEEEDRETFFKVQKVDVAIDGFALNIHDSQHYIRNWFARPALRGYIEKRFVEVVSRSLSPFGFARARHVR